MKQLTNNPKPDSTAKGWQVMCMGCSTFLPSMDFENYLLNFILEKCQIEGAEVRLFSLAELSFESNKQNHVLGGQKT